MKILKEGKRPQDESYRAKCIICKTEVKFLRSEAKFEYDFRDGNYLSVPCPICGHTITKSL